MVNLLIGVEIFNCPQIGSESIFVKDKLITTLRGESEILGGISPLPLSPNSTTLSIIAKAM